MIGARARILRALLRGKKITSLEANRIGRTTEGGRRIREIRDKYPVMKEEVEGVKYCRYYLDPAYVAEYRSKNRMHRYWENVVSWFGRV